MLVDAFGEEKCVYDLSTRTTDGDISFTWTCQRTIDHTHGFKGVVNDIWVVTYESKIDEDIEAFPYSLTLESLVVFEEGNMYGEDSYSFTIGSIRFTNDCTSTDVDETKDLLKLVSYNEDDEKDNSNDNDDPWFVYFYCV